MGVFNIISQYMRNGRRTWSGQFAVAAGAVTAGTVKFKNHVTVTRNGAGLFTFAMFNDPANLIAYRALRLARVTPTFTTPPGGAAEGGWAWTLNGNTVSTNGQFQIRINQQSWAAADPVQTVLMEWVTEMEAA
jgi:hypothetical protein